MDNKMIKHLDEKKDGIDLVIDVLRIINESMTSETHFIYRGVSEDHSPGEIRSGAAVRLRSLNGEKDYEYTYSEYMAYVRSLITEARHNYPENYAAWKDLEILGDLQHNGAATCLVDFSKNLLVSLWFACGGNTQQKNDKNGILYYYDVYEDLIMRNNLKIIKESDLSKQIEDLLVETKPVTNFCSDIDRSFYMWTPSILNNRIARQDSVFIFGLPKFKLNAHSVRGISIPSECKNKIRGALKAFFDISDTSIFVDKHGYAAVNDKLNILVQSRDIYRCGIKEMLNGNTRTALDFFIMYENENPQIHEDTCDSDLNFKYAELHLSKAICYKNLDDFKYTDNAICEYVKARDLYFKGLQNCYYSKDKKEWNNIYSHKLLRTLNDEISLLYKNKEYQRCIDVCDEAIKKIKDLENMGIDKYNQIYCKLSKLELFILIVLNKKAFNKQLEQQEIDEITWNKWNNYLQDAQNETIKTDFDYLLIEFFTQIWNGCIYQSDCIKLEESVETLEKKIESRFANPINTKLSYSSWDFSEIKDAISEATHIDGNSKILLQELVAHMISIRDRYNVKELNSNSKNC